MHQQDPTLDFEPRPYPVEAPGVTFQHRMLQLKVRVKAIIHSLKAVERPPDNLLDFFVTLIEDGNYFGDKYLWSCEKGQLEFNNDAGTRNMIRASGGDGFQPSDPALEDDPSLPSGPLSLLVAGYSQPAVNPKNLVTLASRPEVELDVGRARMMLQNFLLVRMFVGHVVLTPWMSSICRKPTMKPRVINNCRIVATLFYEMIAQNDAFLGLPSVGSLQVSNAVTKGKKTQFTICIFFFCQLSPFCCSPFVVCFLIYPHPPPSFVSPQRNRQGASTAPSLRETS